MKRLFLATLAAIGIHGLLFWVKIPFPAPRVMIPEPRTVTVQLIRKPPTPKPVGKKQEWKQRRKRTQQPFETRAKTEPPDKLKPKSVSKQEPESEPKAEPKREIESRPKPKPEIKPDSKPKIKPKPKPKQKPKPIPKSKPKRKVIPKPDKKTVSPTQAKKPEQPFKKQPPQNRLPRKEIKHQTDPVITPSPLPSTAPRQSSEPSPVLRRKVIPEKKINSPPITTARSEPEENRIITAAPMYDHSPPPVYPRSARRRGYEGQVLLEVRVGVDGRISDVRVAESSGYKVLDKSAVTAVSEWRFKPAVKGGVPMESWAMVPVRFSLQ